jgi:hypothetical protein
MEVCDLDSITNGLHKADFLDSETLKRGVRGGIRIESSRIGGSIRKNRRPRSDVEDGVPFINAREEVQRKRSVATLLNRGNGTFGLWD